MIDLTQGSWLKKGLENLDGVVVSNHSIGSKTHDSFLKELEECRGFLWELRDRDKAAPIKGFHCKLLTINPVLLGVPICSKMEFLMGSRKGFKVDAPDLGVYEGEVNIGQFLEYGQQEEESEGVKKLKEFFSPYYLEGKTINDCEGTLVGGYVFSWDFEYRGYVDAFAKKLLNKVVELDRGYAGFTLDEMVEALGEEEERVRLYLEDLVEAGYLKCELSNRFKGFAYFLRGTNDFEVEKILNSKGCINKPRHLASKTYVNDMTNLRKLTVRELGRILGYEDVAESVDWHELKKRPVMGVWRKVWKFFTNILS